MGRCTLVVSAYTNSTVLEYPSLSRRNGVISAGRVEPALFFSPRKLALVSSPLTRSSDWWGKMISWEPFESEAQKTITRSALFAGSSCSPRMSFNLRVIVIVWRCWLITAARRESYCKHLNELAEGAAIDQAHIPSHCRISPIWLLIS
jgi:hypothetical protein